MPYKRTGKPPGRPRKPLPITEEIMAEPEVASAAVPITETAEFKAAVEGIRTNLMADFMTAMAAAKTNTKDPDGMSSMISDLAMAIAGMADTGDNRKKIAPEEASRRVEAWKRMGAILERVHADGLKPHYELVAATQLEEQLIEQFVPAGDGKWKRNVIIWQGAPNGAMRPVNAIAKEIYTEFLNSIGGSAKNQSGVREHPTWVSYGGLQMVGQPTQSAVNRGLVVEPAEPLELGQDLKPQVEITSVDDPNATLVPILGKTFAPATRAAPGDFGKLQFPSS